MASRALRDRRALEFAIAAAILLLTLAFFWPLIPLGESRADPADMTLLGPGAELASSSLLNSSELAYDSIWVDIQEEEVLRAQLSSEEAAKLLERAAQSALDNAQGDLRERILRGAEAYLAMSNASLSSAEAAKLLDSARPRVNSALDLLLAGDVNGAIEEWLSVKGTVLEARRAIGDALIELSSVDPGALLTDEHRSALNSSTSRLMDLSAELDQLIYLFSLIERDPEAANSAINAALAARRGELDPADASRLTEDPSVKSLLSDSNSLDPGKAGRFASRVSEFRSLLATLLSCSSGQSTGQAGAPTPGTPGGGGAGRGERSDD